MEQSRTVLPESVRRTMVMLLRELIDGPPGEEAYMLNAGDPGLLASLDRHTAAAASARPDGRASVAAHTDHLRYGLELLNRWVRGENPWKDAAWAASWQRQTVTDDSRAALKEEAHAWIAAVVVERPLDAVSLAGTMGSIAHLAYH